MQVLCILIDEVVREIVTTFLVALGVGLLLGVATFDWRGWWEQRPWAKRGEK